VTGAQAHSQLAVTVVADVKPRNGASLKRLLTQMGEDAAGNEVMPLGELSTAHFARLVMLEATKDLDGNAMPAHLIYMSDVDGSLEEHLEELVDLAPAGLDRVLQHCQGYPGPRTVARDDRLAFLHERAVKAGAMYVNTVGRTLRQVQDEARLRDEIQSFLDGGDFEGVEPEAARDAIRRFVKARADLRWALEPVPTPGPLGRAAELVGALGLPLELLALAPVVVPLLPVWALLLRLHELRDRSPTIEPSDAHVRELAALEDFAAQNPFSAVGERKPGLIRLVTAASILRLVDYGSRYIFNNGSLTGVKTIHFARWVFLDDSRRLIFASNYDGSLESYMDDFVNQVWWGLNAVFSNGIGFPRTSWLVFGGAQREQEFKDYLRRREVPTQVWYSAYEDLTAVNLDNNAQIRAGLSGDMSREEVEGWLLRL
jgi:hypothetical protein